MAERDRDYRIAYRSRELDRDVERYDDARRRIPTALDPYSYPEDRLELQQAVAETRARNERLRDEYRKYDSPTRGRPSEDDVSISTAKEAARAGTTKTTYSVTDTGLAKESEVTMRAPSTIPAREPTAPTRVSTFRERDDYDDVRTAMRSSRPYDERDYSRSERLYDIERPRREAGGYVVDVGDANVIGIRSGPGLVESDRGFAGYRNDPYGGELVRRIHSRELPTRSAGYRDSAYADRDARSSAPALDHEVSYMSGAKLDRAQTVKSGRSQGDFKGPSRASTRYEDEWESTTAAPYGPSRQSTRREEDDYAFVERTTTRERPPTVHETFRDPFREEPFDKGRGRNRAETTARAPSEADYVMVSPPRENDTVISRRPTEASERTIRSSLVRDDSYTAEERLRRRRSRSINFKDTDVDGHFRGEKFCERPGAEAEMMGRYLNHYDERDRREQSEYQYGSRASKRDVEADYDRRDSGRYGSRMRSKSRSARREDDDRSYVDSYRSKTTKTSYY